MNSKFEKLSLQWRVTIMTVIILVFCVVVFAIFTMFIAENSFQPVLIDENIVNVMNSEMNLQMDTVVNGENGENHSDIVYSYVDEFSEEALLRYQHSRAVFNTASLIFCVVIIVIGSVIVYFLTKKALSPINELKTQLQNIDEENISERLQSKFGDEQIVSLTQSFNHVLDRLEDAFERQRLFSANASHELKTPLAVIKAGIQVLQIDEDTTLEEYKENAVMMEESVNRLIKVTDNLMLLSFLDEDKLDINEEINLHSMIESVIEEIEVLYSNYLIEVKYNTDVKDILVKGNTMLIYRVVYNIIENAYKYNIQNGYINVSTCIVKDKAILKISNSGKVVQKENKDLLFDAFYRLDTSRSHKKEGSGLGLSIVKSIIEQHKGDVDILTLETGGLEISVSLPISK